MPWRRLIAPLPDTGGGGWRRMLGAVSGHLPIPPIIIIIIGVLVGGIVEIQLFK